MASGSNVASVALPATANTISIGPSGAADLPPGVYYGYSVYESGGSAGVTIVLRDGSATGTILEVIPLTAGQGASDFFGPQGIRVPSGKIYVTITGTGTAAGSVRVG